MFDHLRPRKAMQEFVPTRVSAGRISPGRQATEKERIEVSIDHGKVARSLSKFMFSRSHSCTSVHLNARSKTLTIREVRVC
jgi:hypothetical protein